MFARYRTPAHAFPTSVADAASITARELWVSTIDRRRLGARIRGRAAKLSGRRRTGEADFSEGVQTRDRRCSCRFSGAVGKRWVARRGAFCRWHTTCEREIREGSAAFIAADTPAKRDLTPRHLRSAPNELESTP